MTIARTELEAVEEPLARALRAGGHEVRRQVSCGAGRLDIIDDTNGEIIECKARGDVSSLAAARRQLRRYRHHFFDPCLAIAVPRVDEEAEWLRATLLAEGIRIIEIEKGVGV